MFDGKSGRAADPGDQLSTILDAYQDSEAFRSLAPRTAEDYRRYLAAIGREFGDFPLSGLVEREARAEFMRWRDSVAKRSKRTADYGWSVLARVMSWALDRGLVTTNPCGKGGRVYRASRADNIWTDADEATFLAVASPQMRLAAMWTGQRQGDILRLTWAAYDGTHIRLTQQKTGRRVIVMVGAPLKALLEATQRKSPQIVTNEDGRVYLIRLPGELSRHAGESRNQGAYFPRHTREHGHTPGRARMHRIGDSRDHRPYELGRAFDPRFDLSQPDKNVGRQRYPEARKESQRMTRSSEHFGDKFPTNDPTDAQLLGVKALAHHVSH